MTFGKSKLDELCQKQTQIKKYHTCKSITKLYIIWHKPAKKAAFCYFDNVLLSDIINRLTDGEIVHMTAQYYKHRLKDILL